MMAARDFLICYILCLITALSTLTNGICSIPTIPNASISCSGFGFVCGQKATRSGSIITVTCNFGFTLGKKSSTRLCGGPDWVPPPPTCLPVECPYPIIPNGVVPVFYTPPTVNATVQVHCTKGYTLIGSSILTCSPVGNWAPAIPVCEGPKTTSNTPTITQTQSVLPRTTAIRTTGPVPLSQPGELSLAIICGAVAAAAGLIIIVIITAVCIVVRRRPRMVNNQSRSAGEGHVRHDFAPPDVTADHGMYLHPSNISEYEEIDAQAGPVPASPVGQYEKLQISVNTPIDHWLKEKGMPKEAMKKLKKHKILTIKDLQDMSREDMAEAGLKVGERNQIIRVLCETAISRF